MKAWWLKIGPLLFGRWDWIFTIFLVFYVYTLFHIQKKKKGIYFFFNFIYASPKKKSLIYSKIWTNDNQVQDFTKLIN